MPDPTPHAVRSARARDRQTRDEEASVAYSLSSLAVAAMVECYRLADQTHSDISSTPSGERLSINKGRGSSLALSFCCFHTRQRKRPICISQDLPPYLGFKICHACKTNGSSDYSTGI